jgi:hypothetical protein
MWIFTVYGFYSVSAARNGQVSVRARVRSHLERLRRRFRLRNPIRLTENRDYRYRLWMSKQAWAGILAQLAAEQTWDNFKDAATARIQDKQDIWYVESLHRVWSEMERLQRRVRNSELEGTKNAFDTVAVG